MKSWPGGLGTRLGFTDCLQAPSGGWPVQCKSYDVNSMTHFLSVIGFVAREREAKYSIFDLSSLRIHRARISS